MPKLQVATKHPWFRAGMFLGGKCCRHWSEANAHRHLSFDYCRRHLSLRNCLHTKMIFGTLRSFSMLNAMT